VQGIFENGNAYIDFVTLRRDYRLNYNETM